MGTVEWGASSGLKQTEIGNWIYAGQLQRNSRVGCCEPSIWTLCFWVFRSSQSQSIEDGAWFGIEFIQDILLKTFFSKCYLENLKTFTSGAIFKQLIFISSIEIIDVHCGFCRLLGPLEPEGCGRQRSWLCSLTSAKTVPSSFLPTLASRLPGNSGSEFGAYGEAGMSEASQALVPGETERHKWFWSCLNLQTHRSEAQPLVPFAEGLWCSVSRGVCLILFSFRSLSTSIPESDHPIGSCIHKSGILACFFLVTDEIVLFDMVNMQASQATGVPVSLNNGIWIKHSSPQWAAGSLLHPPTLSHSVKANWATNPLRINTCSCICVF